MTRKGSGVVFVKHLSPLGLTPYRRGRGLNDLDDCLRQSLIYTGGIRYFVGILQYFGVLSRLFLYDIIIGFLLVQCGILTFYRSFL